METLEFLETHKSIEFGLVKLPTATCVTAVGL